jgi:hypothetical protein
MEAISLPRVILPFFTFQQKKSKLSSVKGLQQEGRGSVGSRPVSDFSFLFLSHTGHLSSNYNKHLLILGFK